MKNHKNTILLSVILTIALWLSACVSDSEPADYISDRNFYNFLAYSIVSLESDLYNQNFAGKPSGSIDEEFEGPYGGSIRVTGSDNWAANVNISTRDFTYTFVNVKQIATSSDGKLICNATLNGTLKVKGSFNETYTSESFTSSNMSISGTMTYGSAEREIDEHGNISISASHNKGQTRGEAFDHTVSW